MLETPKVTETADQLIAFIHLTIPSSEVRNMMGPGITEVMNALSDQGIAPAGPWFTHHLRKPSDSFDFKICVPIEDQVAAVGRVKPGRMPASRVARAVYRGPYEGLGAAWGEFGAWIEANGHKSATDLWECYVAGPESSDDPTHWRTELNQPLAD